MYNPNIYKPNKIMISLYDENFKFIRFFGYGYTQHDTRFKRFLAIFQTNDVAFGWWSDTLLEHFCVKRFKRNA